MNGPFHLSRDVTNDIGQIFIAFLYSAKLNLINLQLLFILLRYQNELLRDYSVDQRDGVVEGSQPGRLLGGLAAEAGRGNHVSMAVQGLQITHWSVMSFF